VGLVLEPVPSGWCLPSGPLAFVMSSFQKKKRTPAGEEVLVAWPALMCTLDNTGHVDELLVDEDLDDTEHEEQAPETEGAIPPRTPAVEEDPADADPLAPTVFMTAIDPAWGHLSPDLVGTRSDDLAGEYDGDKGVELMSAATPEDHHKQVDEALQHLDFTRAAGETVTQLAATTVDAQIRTALEVGVAFTVLSDCAQAAGWVVLG